MPVPRPNTRKIPHTMVCRVLMPILYFALLFILYYTIPCYNMLYYQIPYYTILNYYLSYYYVPFWALTWDSSGHLEPDSGLAEAPCGVAAPRSSSLPESPVIPLDLPGPPSVQNNGLLGYFWWFRAIILHTLGVQVS